MQACKNLWPQGKINSPQDYAYSVGLAARFQLSLGEQGKPDAHSHVCFGQRVEYRRLPIERQPIKSPDSGQLKEKLISMG